MISIVHTASLLGIYALPIIVEVDAARGLPQETIVGLPDKVVRESKNRIRSAIKYSGFEYPLRHYTINLSPAEFKKEGPILDLAIAVGILRATQQIPDDPNTLFIGELSLNGELQTTRGLISILADEELCQNKTIFVPAQNQSDLSIIPNRQIVPLASLRDIKCYYNQSYDYKIPKHLPFNLKRHGNDYSDVIGQDLVKRALEIACIGGHNLLLIGPPGSGKSMLMKRLQSVLPLLSIQQSIESYQIHSLVNPSYSSPITPSQIPPIRSPHHSISYAGMVGGGTHPKPGEISLAHHGVLFLDELPEFQKHVIEVLRQPLEDQKVLISRANQSIEYPANLMLVATMNPCPCGYYHDTVKSCTCSPHHVTQYWKKISGPILDRIDIIIHVPRIQDSDYFEKPNHNTPYTSLKMRQRIQSARNTQKKRHQSKNCNAKLTKNEIDTHCHIPENSKPLLKKALKQGVLSGRSFHKVLKVARSIADLENQDQITSSHIAEAIQYKKNPITLSA